MAKKLMAAEQEEIVQAVEEGRSTIAAARSQTENIRIDGVFRSGGSQYVGNVMHNYGSGTLVVGGSVVPPELLHLLREVTATLLRLTTTPSSLSQSVPDDPIYPYQLSSDEGLTNSTENQALPRAWVDSLPVLRNHPVLTAALISYILSRGSSAQDLTGLLVNCGQDRIMIPLILLVGFGVCQFYATRLKARAPPQHFWTLEDAYGIPMRLSVDVVVDFTTFQRFLSTHYRGSRRTTAAELVDHGWFHLMLNTRRGSVMGNSNWTSTIGQLGPGSRAVNSLYVASSVRRCLLCKAPLKSTDKGYLECAMCDIFYRDYTSFRLQLRSKKRLSKSSKVHTSTGLSDTVVNRRPPKSKDESPMGPVSHFGTGNTYDFIGIKNIDLKILHRLEYCSHCFRNRPLNDEYWRSVPECAGNISWGKKMSWDVLAGTRHKQGHNICPACCAICSLHDYEHCAGCKAIGSTKDTSSKADAGRRNEVKGPEHDPDSEEEERELRHDDLPPTRKKQTEKKEHEAWLASTETSRRMPDNSAFGDTSPSSVSTQTFKPDHQTKGHHDLQYNIPPATESEHHRDYSYSTISAPRPIQTSSSHHVHEEPSHDIPISGEDNALISSIIASDLEEAGISSYTREEVEQALPLLSRFNKTFTRLKGLFEARSVSIKGIPGVRKSSTTYEIPRPSSAMRYTDMHPAEDALASRRSYADFYPVADMFSSGKVTGFVASYFNSAGVGKIYQDGNDEAIYFERKDVMMQRPGDLKEFQRVTFVLDTGRLGLEARDVCPVFEERKHSRQDHGDTSRDSRRRTWYKR